MSKKTAAAAVHPPNGSGGKKLSFHQHAGRGVVMKRVSFCVPEPLYNDLQGFADERGDSMTGVIRWSLGMSKAIWDELKAGNRIQVHSSEHKPLKELIFNPY